MQTITPDPMSANLECEISHVAVDAFQDQRPGTSGLRKPVTRFQTSHYVETFVQAVINAVPDLVGGTLIVGGDGRYFSEIALDRLLRVAAANGVSRAVVGQNGWLSTPALSNLIRREGACGGFALTASHNPAGPTGDFGIKFNTRDGGPAPASVTDAAFLESQRLESYAIWTASSSVDIRQPGVSRLGLMSVEVVDPIDAYADLLRSQFDFNAIRKLFADGFTMVFDAMNAISGPYAHRILEHELGAIPGTVIRGTPLADFGGIHPDPTPHHLGSLGDLMRSDMAPDFAAASDGDGDRNLVFGRSGPVSPSDSLAVLCANASLVPAFPKGVRGVARSLPTSRAVDRVAHILGIPAYMTPTGWKFFSSLLEAGRIDLCGEESAGTGSIHVREKDGLWAVLMWLNILAASGKSVDGLLSEHWREFGRDLYTRHDYEGVESAAADKTLHALGLKLPHLVGSSAGSLKVSSAEIFDYKDLVTGEIARNQGYVVTFEEDARFVLRASGTGTRGATLRLYCERAIAADVIEATDRARRAHALAAVVEAASEITNIKEHTGFEQPTSVS